MLRSIAKWYISRAVDCNQYLPAWVERRIARDRQLKEFYDQSQQLAARLRSAESTFAGSCEVELPRLATTRSTRSTALLGTLAAALAAVVLFALVPLFNRSSRNSLSEPSEIAQQHTESDARADAEKPAKLDPEQVRNLIAGGRNLIQRLKQTPAGTAEADLDQLVAFVNLDINQVIEPVNDLGASYGSLLSNLDRHVESENQRLISGGVDAWNYFVRKLPQSAASLAGL